MSNKRFDEIIRQRNRERLEKSREYYSNPENYKDASPTFIESVKKALEHDELVVYAPQYFIVLPALEKAIQNPIYNGQDLDDLLYFFDPDYVLKKMEHVQPPGGNTPDLSDYDLEFATRPFLFTLYAKYKALAATGMDTATNFNMELLDHQIEEEILKNLDGWKDLDALANYAYAWCKNEDRQEDITDSLFYKTIEAALHTLQSISQATTQIEGEDLPSIAYKKANTVGLSIDKFSTIFFGFKSPPPKEDIDGQMSFIPVKYEKTGAPEITLFYNYRFDDDIMEQLKLKKKITDEDYFILNVIGNEWLHGNVKTTPNKLYKELTGTDPNQTQLTEFTNQLVKLASTTIYIKDREVKEAWGISDPNATYKDIVAQVAPITIGSERFIVNGKVVRAGMRIYGFPEILNIGNSIGQWTTVPKALLQVKKADGRAIKRTGRFYAALHYLIKRIAQIKDGTSVNKILYETYYEELDAKTPRSKQLANNLLFEILDHFVRCKWITGYKEETAKTTGKPGITIRYDDQHKKITTAIKKKRQQK